MQGKVKSYKKQIEEAEEIAALNLAKFRQTQNSLGSAEERAEAGEAALAKNRLRARSASLGPVPHLSHLLNEFNDIFATYRAPDEANNFVQAWTNEKPDPICPTWPRCKTFVPLLLTFYTAKPVHTTRDTQGNKTITQDCEQSTQDKNFSTTDKYFTDWLNQEETVVHFFVLSINL